VHVGGGGPASKLGSPHVPKAHTPLQHSLKVWQGSPSGAHDGPESKNTTLPQTPPLQ
jgi:hypothetical protein